ncbi:MAG: Ig-like domain-containing protein [Kofleriaceae bacterium]
MKLAAVSRPSTLASLGLGCLVALAASAGSAQAADDLPGPPDFLRPTTGYVWEPQAPDVLAGGGQFSRTMYLNDCKPNGCTVRYGNTDSRTDYSYIPENGVSTLGAFARSSGDWAEFMQCMRETFAPFDIDVTDVDPGTASHMEVMVAGHPNDLGLGNGIGGIAPYQCGYIYNSLSFAFSDVYGGDMLELCATAAQEVAHTWGLDHEMLASDPMTYLNYSGQRSFKNQAVNCGEYSARSCYCGGSTQNSFQEIVAVFGASEPTPPVVEITAPENNAQVGTSFVVRVDISDENGVARTELWIDNQKVEDLATPPYVYNAPASLADGTHTVEVRAFDTQDTMGSDSVTVILGEPCQIPGDCLDAGEGYTCVGGRCVPGEGVVGGLGTACISGTECFSGVCSYDGTDRLCTESCTLGAGQCPGGFGCLDDGQGGGVCWPGVDEGGGCAAGSDGTPTLPIALGLAFGALVWPRRRRRRA